MAGLHPQLSLLVVSHLSAQHPLLESDPGPGPLQHTPATESASATWSVTYFCCPGPGGPTQVTAVGAVLPQHRWKLPSAHSQYYGSQYHWSPLIHHHRAREYLCLVLFQMFFPDDADCYCVMSPGWRWEMLTLRLPTLDCQVSPARPATTDHCSGAELVTGLRLEHGGQQCVTCAHSHVCHCVNALGQYLQQLVHHCHSYHAHHHLWLFTIDLEDNFLIWKCRLSSSQKKFKYFP